MNEQIIEWLLDGPYWIKHAVEMHLLGSHPSSQNVLSDGVVVEIVDRLKDKRRGIPAIRNGNMNADEYENPYWDLFFLADLGLKAADLKLNSEINDFLKLQHQDGAYLTECGMQSNYLCKSAIIISSIARRGY